MNQALIVFGLSTQTRKVYDEFLNKFGDNELGDSSFGANIFFGVGAAFDFHAGLIPQAPSWVQVCGLEWLYRLFKEPRRLWKNI